MTRSTASTADRSRDRGTAPVEFVLVSVLLLVLVLGIVQLGIALHVRNTLVASAAEGARYAANADRDLADGEQRTREVIGEALDDRFAQDVTASYDEVGGAEVGDGRGARDVAGVRVPRPVAGAGRHGARPGGGRPLTTRRRLRTDDSGSAMIEYVFLSVLLLVPLVYLVLSVSVVQRTSYAATQAAREAGRAYVTAESTGVGEERALAAARLAFTDQGIELPEGALAISCSADPCLTPGAVVTVSIDARADLPGVPALGDRGIASVAVSAKHAEVVDAFREVPE